MTNTLPERRIFFEIDSDLETVSLIGLSINRICIHLSFDTTEAYRIELAVVEVITNCIRHAYKNISGYKINVTFEIFTDYIQITVTDMGERFDQKYLKKGGEVDPENPDTFPVGGMGIHLILSIMDDVQVKWEDNSNKWILKKFLIEKGE